MYKNGIWVKTQKDYEREMIALDEELFEINQKMRDLKQEFIDKFGLPAWNAMFDRLRYTV